MGRDLLRFGQRNPPLFNTLIVIAECSNVDHPMTLRQRNSSVFRNCAILCACLFASTELSAANDAPSTDVSMKMQAVIGGIVPAVTIKGEPNSNVTLINRMATLNVPGVSIALIHNGAVMWTAAFGVADVSGTPLGPDTKFQAGSVSELFTSVAVMQLVQAGKLRLDSDVNTMLKSWRIPRSGFTDRSKVTLRKLLNHSAGITVDEFAGYPIGATVPTALQTLDGISPANNSPVTVNTIPGTAAKHSSGGYQIIQQLITDQAGEPFASVLNSLVLSPDNLKHTTVDQSFSPGAVNELAKPYDQLGRAVPKAPYLYPELAAAGVWTTPTDVARLALRIQAGLSGRLGSGLSKASAAEIVKPGLDGWGLGVRLGGHAGHAYIERRGEANGYASYVVMYESGDGVVIMTNGANGAELVDELRRTIAHQFSWADFQPIERSVTPVSSDLTDRYVGYYRLGRYRMLRITKQNNHIFAKLPGLAAREIFPIDELIWFFADNNQIINFEIGSNNVAKSVTDHLNIETSAARVDSTTAKQIDDQLTAKLKGQLKDPLTEAALRNYISKALAGIPDYDSMIPGLAATTEQQLPDLQTSLRSLGALQSVTFAGVGADGSDLYIVKFDKRSTEWEILIGADGNLERVSFQLLY